MSNSSTYLDTATLFTTNTNGFQFQSQLTSDKFCIQDKICYDADFLSVFKMQQNFWLYEEDLSEVGGTLGLSYDCHTCSSFWRNYDKIEKSIP